MLILVNNVHEKTLQKVKADEFWRRARAICYNFALVLQLCTSVTALHSSYMRMHSFSANLVTFSYRLLQSVKKLYNHQGELWLMNKLSQRMHLWSGRPVQYVHEKKNDNENNCCWTLLIVHTIESEFVERKLQAITACQICMVSRLHIFLFDAQNVA